MAWVNIYWNILEIEKFGCHINHPLLDPIFMGAVKNTHEECLDGIVRDSPAIHYIDTIEIPDFADLVKLAREILDEN